MPGSVMGTLYDESGSFSSNLASISLGDNKEAMSAVTALTEVDNSVTPNKRPPEVQKNTADEIEFAKDHGLDHLLSSEHMKNIENSRFFNSAHQRYETIGLQKWKLSTKEKDYERLEEANFTKDLDSYTINVPTRLIDVNTGKIITNRDVDPKEIVQRYAILSHRWLPGDSEITYEDYKQMAETAEQKILGSVFGLDWEYVEEIFSSSYFTSKKKLNFGRKEYISEKKKGLEKLRGAIKMTKALGIRYLWADTCCIDKSPEARPGETESAINSMGTWYFNAQICIVFLADFHGENIEKYVKHCNDTEREPGSTWASRAWTLQEILMSQNAYVFNADWFLLGDALCNYESIGKACKIDPDLICRTGSTFVEGSDIFAAASQRVATVPEDYVYSLIGTLGISTFIKYGESFSTVYQRILRLLVHERDDISIFNWIGAFKGSTEPGCSMFPCTMKAYEETIGKPEDLAHRGKMVDGHRTRSPYGVELTARGVSSVYDICLIEHVTVEEAGKDNQETIEWLQRINKAREQAGDRSTGYILTKTILWYRTGDPNNQPDPCDLDKECTVGSSCHEPEHIGNLHHKHVVARTQRHDLEQVLEPRVATSADVKWAWVRFAGTDKAETPAPWFLTQITTTPNSIAFNLGDDEKEGRTSGLTEEGRPMFKIRTAERLATDKVDWKSGKNSTPVEQFHNWFCIG